MKRFLYCTPPDMIKSLVGYAQLAAHVKRELPESEEEIKAFINDVLPPPTAIIFSGHGVHLIYILAVPICITDEASRKRAIELQQAFFRYVSRSLGFTPQSFKMVR